MYNIKIIFFTILAVYFSPIICIGKSNRFETHISSTPSLYSKTPKPDITKNNNLRSKNGKQAKGKHIKIIGKVVDTNGVGIPNAHVFLWQPNALGAFEHQNDFLRLKDPNFLGSGMSITNNLGNFIFFTVMPGIYKNRAPHLHIISQVRELLPLETQIFFPNMRENEIDPILLSVPKEKRYMIIAEKIAEPDSDIYEEIYKIRLVMKGKLLYKTKRK